MAGRRYLLTWLLVSVVGLGTVTTARGATIYVDADATGANDGTSWADAHNYLQDALVASLDGDEIWVAEGTYKPDRGLGITLGDRTATFELKDGVALYGGFPSGGGNWEDRDPIAYETILSGDLNSNDVPVADPYDLLDEPTRADNSYHVVTASGTDETAVLDGFTITAGNANGSSYPHQYGGGLINDGSPTLADCTFTANAAEYSGGGMANDTNAGPTLTECTFNGNAAASGGGVLNNGTGMTLMDCTFMANRATSGAGMHNYESNSSMLTNCTFSGNSATYGGGMHNLRSSPTLTNCTFSDNSAQYGNGGGMYNESSSPTVTDCTFSGNSTDRGGGMANFDSSSPAVTNCAFSDNTAVFNVGGGGMCNCSSSPTVINCSFSGNEAVRGGGMSNWPSSSPTVTNCTFSGNTAGDGGGGMFNRDSSSPTVTNSTFFGNSTLEDGGGMHNMISSSPTLTNCTFSGNEAGTAPGYSGHGGGMSNWSSSSPTVTNCAFTQNSAGASEGGGGMYNLSCSPTVTNCILWGDLPPEISNSNSSAFVTYCDVLGGYAGEGNVDTDPLFMDADGPDDTVGTADDDLRLSAGSSCIDAGDNSAVPAGITTDLDGLARFLDDPATLDSGNGTPPIVDMGAYEFQANRRAVAGTVYTDLAAPSTSGVSGVGITVAGAGGTYETSSAGIDGSWYVSNVVEGTYTVIPAKAGYTFEHVENGTPDGQASVVIEVSEANQTANQDIQFLAYAPPVQLHDWNGDGIVSIVGDVPPFVNCVYFQNCPTGVDVVVLGDCNHDGLISIVGDVPCFVDCVYFDNCPE